jgi:hypothetical protein
MGQAGAGVAQAARHVDVEDPVQLGGRGLGERAHEARARVADEHVQAAQPLDRCGDGPLGVGVGAHIRGDVDPAALARHGGAPVRVAAREGDGRALGGEPAHHLGAEPRRPARDEGGLPGQA